jgi:glycosyltransferase involved in cell wall biosynthesis/peptidoglycan/xylan/chitin deacetylase (PgdA/CDA1 family)
MTESSKPRIVFISLEYAPVIGGAEKQTRTLAETLAAAGFPVSVLTRRHKGLPESETLNGVEIKRIRTVWLPFLSWLSFIGGVLLFVHRRKKENMILQAQILSVPALAAAFCARVFNKPALVKLAAGGPGGNIDTLLRSRLGRYKFNLLKENLDYFIAINQEVRDELAREGITTRKVKYLSNGVDTDLYRPITPQEKEKIRSSLKIGTGPLIVYSGRLHKVKNLAVLIESIGQMKTTSAAKLLIIGSGPEEKALKKQVASMRLTEKIIFLPMQEEVRQFLQAADIFVLPSQREGIANALLEAMSCGLAPVVSNVGGNKELVQAGKNGLVVEPGNVSSLAMALSRLAEDNKLRSGLGAAARQRVVANYSLAATIAGYLDIYGLMGRQYFKQEFPVLAYHRVREHPEYGMDVSTSEFTRQMEWLYKSGWRTVSLDRIKECLDKDQALPDKSFAITFDDGHKDNYSQALPLLKKYGFSALIYLTAGYIGTVKYTAKTASGRQWLAEKPANWDDGDKVNFRKFEFLSWAEIREMKAAGLEFGGHTLNHPRLTSLPLLEQQREVGEAKRLIDGELGSAIKHFCYPYQDFNQDTEDIVRQAGYLTASYAPSHYDLTFFWDDAYALERLAIYGEVSLRKFKLLVSGRYFQLRKALTGSAWGRAVSVKRRLT